MDKILEQPCLSHCKGGHNIVKRAVQCKHCHELADSTEELLKKDCIHTPKCASEPLESPAHDCREGVSKQSPAPATEVDPTAELLEAQEWLRQLKVLKELEDQRSELERQLLQSKSTSVGF